MIILGITGPTGAGKTTVSEIFEKNGIKVIDTDTLAREVVEPGKPALQELCLQFGEIILNPDGTLNRRKLAHIAFSDSESHSQLNKITHYHIGKEVDNIIKNYTGKIIGIDGAVLIGSGIEKICTYILSVIADEEIRKKRIMKRDSISEQDADLRISSQKNNSFYIENSDYIVYNNGTENLEEDVLKIINELRSMI